ncbi:MAG: calcium/sodium antiporter [Proteobacteria bacterium]|nr:calcium/sodium antiporter [Pseudomonadota bacterium]MBU1687513.1 calcium/sodium antiporter [Pseudomonadota bacterium]
MGIEILILLAGFGLLLGGGDALVRGASAFAKKMGISPLVVGMTVVAFGTSAPELAINTMAAIRKSSTISFGNIVGSNIANIGLILGISALLKPLAIDSTVIKREIPMMLLASLAAIIMGFDSIFRQAPNTYDLSDGLIFLLFFCVFLYYTASDIFKPRQSDQLVTEVQEATAATPFRDKTAWQIILIIGGLSALIGGGNLTVDAAVEIATLIGIPEAVIGLTIIAVGTSLPELVTSLVATWRGQTSLAIGNVVGSNIFNILFILGTCSIITPVIIPQGGLTDLLVMGIFALILLPFSITDKGRIMRWEGLFLVLSYLGYTAWLIIGR